MQGGAGERKSATVANCFTWWDQVIRRFTWGHAQGCFFGSPYQSGGGQAASAMMNDFSIVVLDGHTLSPQAPGHEGPDDPSWSGLAALGRLKVYPRTAVPEILGRCDGAAVVLTNKVPITAQTMDALPDLRYIGVMATGTNVIDCDAARERGIVVTNVPGYSTMSVAQHVFALLLELAARTGPTAAAVRDGAWERSQDFSFRLAPSRELAGRTFGLLGLGAIGQAVAGIAHAFGMEVLVQSRTRKQSATPMTWVDDPDEVFSRADVVSLHCPLTSETHHLVDARRLALMKKDAWLINTGRGPLVDEAALAAALTAGTIAGYGADVLSVEPPAPGSNPLIVAPNTVITPHIAWASVEARGRLMQSLVSNLRAWMEGSPVNVVN